jgi:protein required for attachment to host cells
MKQPRTMILLASEREARVLMNEGHGTGLKQIAHITPGFDPDELDWADQAGRTFDSMGRGRHGKEPHTTVRELVRNRFARELADWLAEAARADRFDRLILTAAPPMLGALRGLLDAAVTDRLDADLAKDLVNIPLGDLGSHFADRVKL